MTSKQAQSASELPNISSADRLWRGCFKKWFVAMVASWMKDEVEVLEEHNQQFRDESNEEQLLPILFDVPAEGRGEFMTTAQISERLVTYGNIKKPMALSRLGMVLGAAGYQSTRPKIGGQLIRGWLVYQRDTDEIASLRRLLKE